MVEGEELEAIARGVIDPNRFMTIGTADEEGVPRVSPVRYAPAGYGEFFWVSDPEARHSRNIAAWPPRRARVPAGERRQPVGRKEHDG